MTILAASPLSQPQYDFLSSPAKWCCYGGAAGSGKTHALSLDMLRHCQGPHACPDFRGAIFRRKFPQITTEGGLLDHTKAMYGPLGATYNHTAAEFRFPSGAKIGLRTIQYEKDLDNFQGAQFDAVAFDESTQFPLNFVQYIWGRSRSKSGIKTTVRMSCNPDNDSWLYRFLFWWISPTTGLPIRERSGVIRHFILRDNKFEWFDEPRYNDNGDEETTSATFIGATLSDNKALEQSDPSYRSNLESLPPAEKERFLDGNWLSGSSGDTEWPRDLFLDVFVPDEHFPIPENQNCVRMFTIDPSKGRAPKKGDYSAIVCLAQTKDLAYVDADLKRRPPGQIIEDLFLFCEDPLHRIRSGDLIGIETLQFQELFRDMIYLYAKDHPEYALSIYLKSGSPIIQVEDTLNKMMRIRRLDRPIRNRQFRYRNNPGTTLLLQQLKTFTGIPEKGKHDDGPDALDMANQLPRHREEMYRRMREGK